MLDPQSSLLGSYCVRAEQLQMNACRVLTEFAKASPKRRQDGLDVASRGRGNCWAIDWMYRLDLVVKRECEQSVGADGGRKEDDDRDKQ